MPQFAYRLLFLLFGLLLFAGAVFSAPTLKLEISGIKDSLLTNVQSRLTIEQHNIENTLDAAHVAAFAETSKAAVKSALQPYGYYDAEVQTSVIQKNNEWIIRYHIKSGQPVRISDVQVKVIGEGGENKKIRRAVANFPLKDKDIFNSVTYTDARDKLFDVINNEGYIKAVSKESKVLVNTSTHRASIHLTIQTNKRYYFGKVNFNKNAYAESFMRRFDVFDENEPFSSNKLLQYQQEMNNSRYFKQVLVIPDFNAGNDVYVPMQASVVPANYHRYNIGLGYGTFTQFRLTAGLQLRRLTDTGQSLEALVKLSSVLSGVGLKYYIPGRNPLTEQWMIGGNLQKFSPQNGASHSKTVTFGYTRKLHRWQLSANINYLWERYSVENMPHHNSQLVYPSLNLSYLKTDNIVKPTYGRSLNLLVQGASQNLLSSTGFLQAELHGKVLMTPFSFARLILRGDAGYTVVHELNDLPLSMRFFAGGINSVRGYGDSSIGPGKYLGVASIEYRNHIAYDLYGAVFYDIGTATNHYGQNLVRGAGVGLVYESPVGPIKVYGARALSKRGMPHSIEFSMGPEF